MRNRSHVKLQFTCHILPWTVGPLQWHSRLARRAYKSVSTEKREGREFEPPLEQGFPHRHVEKTLATGSYALRLSRLQSAARRAGLAPARWTGAFRFHKHSACLASDSHGVRRRWRDAPCEADAHYFMASMGLEPMTFALLARRSNQLS